MEYYDVLSKRRMYRHFDSEPVPIEALDKILHSATRAPSAGFTQGSDFLVLTDPGALERFWNLALTSEWKARTTSHENLWQAPVVVLPLANPQAYVDRYAEPDKSYSNLITEGDWPVPYWHIDTAFATMLILNAVVNERLGALFFGLFRNVDLIKSAFGIPANYIPIGAIAIGHPIKEEHSNPTRRTKRELLSQLHMNHF